MLSHISYSNSFKDVKNIVNTLSKKELNHICTGTFKNSPYVVYREVLLIVDDPAAFIDVYSIPKEMKKDEAVVVCACKKEYRGNGYIKTLGQRMIPKLKLLGIKKIYWETTKSNLASSSIAKDLGFTKSKDINKDDDNYVLFTESTHKTSSKKLNIPQEIIDFNKTLNKDFSYGVVYKGKVITNLDEFNFFENYKSLTIREFEKYKTGICWDFTHYEANWFKKHGYEYETYYIEGLDKDGDPHTHTFLLFYLNDSSKTYYFESAWEKYKGIEEFDNTTGALKTIKERHIKDYKGDIKDIICVKIDLSSNNFEGLSCEDYMIKASKGKTRFSLNDYKICYRVTYKGEGVYQALKNKLTKTEEGRKIWNQFLDNEDWLDKPPSYSKNDKSYFTKSGLDKFKKSKDYELMKKYLKNIDIEIIEINNKNIKYEDQYQVIAESKENATTMEQVQYNTLYHGSHNDIKGNTINIANKSYEDKDYVFATYDILFALCFAGNPWHDGIFNLSYYNGELTLIEKQSGALKKTFDTDGYIYIISDSDINKFKARSKHVLISDKSVKYSERIYIKNVLDELKLSNIKIYNYPSKPNWFNSKFNNNLKRNATTMEQVQCNTMGFYGNYFTESTKLSLSNFKREDTKPKIKDNDVLAQYIIKWKDKNKLVANVTITHYDNGDNFIHDLEVSKEYRGNGFSYQILDVAVKEFKGNCLFVKADNKIAIHTYEKYGFKKTNENYEGKKDGLKCYIMRI